MVEILGESFLTPGVSLSLSPHTASLKTLTKLKWEKNKDSVGGGSWGRGRGGRGGGEEEAWKSRQTLSDVIVWGVDSLGMER